MKTIEALKTPWTDNLSASTEPNPASLREHLLEVHRRNPGFTESCALKCRDANGQSTYDWLAAIPEQQGEQDTGKKNGQNPENRILDLACGSGLLLEKCRDRFAGARLYGVDMSEAELGLARRRLQGRDVSLIQGVAQDLCFAQDNAFDTILCHWALTLMDPIEPVFSEIARTLRAGGVFAAIVDGDPAMAPGYQAIDETVFGYVKAELPAYGDRDLGDPRTRNPDALLDLARTHLPDADITIHPATVALSGPADRLAAEAVGFFYAAFVLPTARRQALIEDVAKCLATLTPGDEATFTMPVCMLTARI
ncbi:MAG: class I SAM-dependent methyltransferase [Pseudomonadota bacterium]